MLVLVSFGLVLLATILLVVGLLNGDASLTLIYLSIAASATAAVVLYVAFRRARPSTETTTTAPAPLAEDIAEPSTDESPTTVTPAAAAPASDPAEPTAAPASTSDEDWMSDAEWEGDVDFPIADYDDLTLAEVMPLLPQLYSDELDEVIERERAGKNRSSIIDRLEELKRVGTDADAAEAETEAALASDSPDETGFEPEPEPAPAPAPDQPAPAPAPLGGTSSLLDLEGGDDEESLFPIADYDGLSVSQIVPLLPQLEADELEEVRAREVAGAGRKTLITEIDALLPSVPREETPAPAPARKATSKKRAPKAATSRKAASKKKAAPKKKAASKKKAAPKKKAPSKTSAAKKKTTSKKKASKKKAASSPRFPISDYDELNVSDIRPRLSDLSNRQLEQVREREVAGAGRKTILDEIDRRLS